MAITEPVAHRKKRFTKRLFPTKPQQKVTTTRLSIVDAAIAGFSSSGAVWFYDKTEGADANDPSFAERLESSLKETLNDFPHYAGQVSWATPEQVKGSDNPRHLRRPVVTYGSPKDPGVEFIVMDMQDAEVRDFAPSYAERMSSKKAFNTSSVDQMTHIADTNLALSNLNVWEGLPGVAIQVNAFKCGGYSISYKMTHSLGDATSLLQFMHRWTERSRKLFPVGFAAKPVANPPTLQPLFNPSLMDKNAKLNPLELQPDEERFRRARSLPMHRFHFWPSDNPAYRDFGLAFMPPPYPVEEMTDVEFTPSTEAPLTLYNPLAPVETWQLHFGKDEVARMKKAAMAALPGAKTEMISRQDALLAHLWILINRARRLHDVNEPVYMDLMLGLRSRVSPPLQDNFIGSPILLSYAKSTGPELCSSVNIGDVAALIRKTLSLFTPDAVSDYLYDAAHEFCPQRLGQAFVGPQHVVVTSWARSRAYEVDFCGAGPARYVHAIMPNLDGVLELTDVGATGDFEVSLALEKDALARLMNDPDLRAYA